MDLTATAAASKQAARVLATCTTAHKNAALEAIARQLKKDADAILNANEQDVQTARARGMEPGLIDRLALTAARLDEMIAGVRAVAALGDPIGEMLSETAQPNGLVIRKICVPLGVIGMIYEARPNVTTDAAVLALKTGNAMLLRGSDSAMTSNKALVAAMQAALTDCGLPAAAVALVTEPGRETALAMMRLNGLIDVLIPRGSAGLIQDVVRNATVPVIETGIGNCHVFIDQSADPAMALPIAVNAKTSRPSVCNAAEKLLIHRDWSRDNVVAVLKALGGAGVELRADDRIRERVGDAVPLAALPESEYGTEYLAMILGVLMVDDCAAAIAHINTYGSGHSEAIVTADAKNAAAFLGGVDAACVYHNASTRFTDGFEFGLGAEIGISTQKLHARGPMGLREMTSYKYTIAGSGQIR